MLKKNKTKRVISFIMAVAMMVMQVPLGVFAAEPLTLDEVNADKTIINKSFTFDGVEKNVTLVNDADAGYSYLTGDVVFISGTNMSYTYQGEYVCRDVTGQLKLDILATDMSIVSQSGIVDADTGKGETITYAMYIVDSNNNLYRFNNIDYDNYLEPISTGNVGKLMGEYYLDTDDNTIKLCENKKVVAEEVKDFVIITDSIAMITHTDDTLEYVNLNRYGTEGILVVTKNEDTLKEFYYNVEHGACFDINDISFSADNTIYEPINLLSPVEETTDMVKYSLFDGKIIIELDNCDSTIGTLPTFNYLKVYSTDGSLVEYKDTIVKTDYGYVKIGESTPRGLNRGEECFIEANPILKADNIINIIKRPRRFQGNIVLGGYLVSLSGNSNVKHDTKWTIKGKDTYSFITKNTISGVEKQAIVELDFTNRTVDITNSSGATTSTSMSVTTSGDYISFSADRLSTAIYNACGFNPNYDMKFEYSSTLDELIVYVGDNNDYKLNCSGVRETYSPITFSFGDTACVSIDSIEGKDFSVIGTCSYFEKNYSDEIDLSEMSNNVYSSTGYYTLANNGDLYEAYEDTSIETRRNMVSFDLVDNNVVKVNENGYYLKSDGTVYKDDVAVATGVDNLYGNIIKQGDEYTNISTCEEFLLHRSTDWNVKITQTRLDANDTTATLTITKDDGIEKIIAPDSSELTDNVSIYEVYQDGIYVFRAINTYGEEFSKSFIVEGLGNVSSYLPEMGVVAGNIFVLDIPENITIKYSADRTVWTEYNAETGIEYAGEPIFVQGFSNNSGGNVIKVTIDENGKADIENLTQEYIGKDEFRGYGYLVDNTLYSFNGDYAYATYGSPTGLTSEGAVWNKTSYQGNDGNFIASSLTDGSISNLGSNNAGGKLFSRIFMSDKLIEDNGIENPIAMFLDDVYTYIVGASGDVVKAADQDTLTHGSSITSFYTWEETWLGTATDVNEYTGEITMSDGTVIDTCYNATLGVAVEDLPFYTKEDVAQNLFFSSSTYTYDTSLLTPVDVNIVAKRVISGGYAVVDDNDTIWMYHENAKGMVSRDKITKDNSLVDVSIDYTDWTNDEVKVTFDVSDTSTKYWEDITTSSSIYMQSAQPTAGVSEPNMIISDDGSTLKLTYGIYASTYVSNYYLKVGYYDEATNSIINILPSKITNTVTGVSIDNPTESDFLEGSSRYATDICEVEYSLDEGEYYFYASSGTTIKADTVSINDEVINLNMFRMSPFIVTNNNSAFAANEYELTYEGDGKYSTYLKSGSYNIELRRIGSNFYTTYYNNAYIYTAGNADFNVLNVDTVNPRVEVSVDSNGEFTFTGKDVVGTGEDVDSAVSGVDKLYWSEDNDTFSELSNGGKIVYNRPARDGNTAVSNSKTIYVYTVDKAGNESGVSTYNIGLDINKEIIYENGKTTVEFWGDDDDDWTDTDYDYKYTIEDDEEDGHTVEVTEDTEVTIKVTKDTDPDTIKQETLSLEVVTVDKPTVERVDNTNVINITAGAITNGTFKELYVKVDNGEFVKYTDTSAVVELTDLGTHTVQAYQVATKDGQDIESEIETKEFTVLGDNTLKTDVTYENGKTKVEFWSNDDTDGEEFDYSYVVNNTTVSSNLIVVNDDTDVDIKSTRENYKDAEDTLSIKVVAVDKPVIERVDDTNVVNITAGAITNGTFKELYVKVDNGEFVKYYSNTTSVLLDGIGPHTVKAYQVAEREGQDIISEVETKEFIVLGENTLKTDVTYENGKTTVEFWSNDDTDGEEFDYSYVINNTTVSSNLIVVNDNADVDIKSTKEYYEDAEDTLSIIVVSTDKPVIERVGDTNVVNIEAGNITNGTLKELYVKVDDGEFVKYEFTTSAIAELIGLGSHTVKAYQVVERDGQDIISDVETKEFTIIGDNILHTDITYENGKTTVEFWSNDDTDGEDFDYSYEIDENVTTGNKITISEDSTIIIKSSKENYNDAEATLNVKVVETDKPLISNIIENEKVEVTIGIIENAELKELLVKVDDGKVVSYNTNKVVLEGLTVGEHTVYANQIAETTIDGKLVTVTSDSVHKVVVVGNDEPVKEPETELETEPETETTPEPNDKPVVEDQPQTGDAANIRYYALILVIGSLIVGSMTVFTGKAKED